MACQHLEPKTRRPLSNTLCNVDYRIETELVCLLLLVRSLYLLLIYKPTIIAIRPIIRRIAVALKFKLYVGREEPHLSGVSCS